jgi:hypothetical protein
VTKIIEVGLETTICFVEMDEARNKQHRIWMQIANVDLIVVTEPLQEWMYGNTKSVSKDLQPDL